MVIPYNIFDIPESCVCGWAFHTVPNTFNPNKMVYTLSEGLGTSTSELEFQPGEESIRLFPGQVWDNIIEFPFDAAAEDSGIIQDTVYPLFGISYDYDAGQVLVQQAFTNEPSFTTAVTFWNVRPAVCYMREYLDPIKVGDQAQDVLGLNPWGFLGYNFYDDSFIALEFFEYGNGVWVTGTNNGGFSRSTDGGQTWSGLTYPGDTVPPHGGTAPQPQTLTYGGQRPIQGIEGLDSDVWGASVGDQVVRSLDKGQTWEFSLVFDVTDFSGTSVGGWIGPENMEIAPQVLGLAYGNNKWIAGALAARVTSNQTGTIQINSTGTMDPNTWGPGKYLISQAWDLDYFEGGATFAGRIAAWRIRYFPHPSGNGGRWWIGLNNINCLLFSDDDGETWDYSFCDHGQLLSIDPAGTIDPVLGIYTTDQYQQFGDRMFYEIGGLHPFFSWRNWPFGFDTNHYIGTNRSRHGFVRDMAQDPENPWRIIAVGRSWDMTKHPSSVYCFSDDFGDTWGEVYDLPPYWEVSGTCPKDSSQLTYPPSFNQPTRAVALEGTHAEDFFSVFGAGDDDYDYITITGPNGDVQTRTVHTGGNSQIISNNLQSEGYIFVEDPWTKEPDATYTYRFFRVDRDIQRVIALCGDLNRDIQDSTPVGLGCYDDLEVTGFQFFANDGNQGAATPLAGLNEPWLNATGGQDYRLRIAIKNTGGFGVSNLGFRLDYRLINQTGGFWEPMASTDYIGRHNPTEIGVDSWYGVVYPAMAFKARLLNEGYTGDGSGLGHATNAYVSDGAATSQVISTGAFSAGKVDTLTGEITGLSIGAGETTEIVFLLRNYSEMVDLNASDNEMQFRVTWLGDDSQTTEQNVGVCSTVVPRLFLTNTPLPEFEVVTWSLNGVCEGGSITTSHVAYSPATYVANCASYYTEANYNEVRVLIRETAGGYAGPRIETVTVNGNTQTTVVGDIRYQTFPDAFPPDWLCDQCQDGCPGQLTDGPPNGGELNTQSKVFSTWHGAHLLVQIQIDGNTIVRDGFYAEDYGFLGTKFDNVGGPDCPPYKSELSFDPFYATTDITDTNNDYGENVSNTLSGCTGWSGSSLFITKNNGWRSGETGPEEAIRATGDNPNIQELISNLPLYYCVGENTAPCCNPNPPIGWEASPQYSGCDCAPFIGYQYVRGYAVDWLNFYGKDYAEYGVRFGVSDRAAGLDVTLKVSRIQYAIDNVEAELAPYSIEVLFEDTIATI